VALSAQEDIGPAIVPFLNRLSDYLFVLARWVALSAGEKETIWEH
jgi:cob(I)alamin adenosyltransferase